MWDLPFVHMHTTIIKCSFNSNIILFPPLILLLHLLDSLVPCYGQILCTLVFLAVVIPIVALLRETLDY